MFYYSTWEMYWHECKLEKREQKPQIDEIETKQFGIRIFR